MFFFDCEQGYVADDGQNDVTDGSVENYDFNWDEETVPNDTVNNDTGDSSDSMTINAADDTIGRPTETPTNVLTDDTETRADTPVTAEGTSDFTTSEIIVAPSGNTINNTMMQVPFAVESNDLPSNALNDFPGTPSGNVVTGIQQS